MLFCVLCMVHVHVCLNVVRSTSEMQRSIFLTKLNATGAVNVCINFRKYLQDCRCVWILTVHVETLEGMTGGQKDSWLRHESTAGFA